MTFRHSVYISQFLSKRLRHELKQADPTSAEIDKKSHMELVVEAAKKGDQEAACAAFLALWQTLKMGCQPDSVLLDYFEPKFVEIALYGMSLGLRNLQDEASLPPLDDIFNINRPKTGTNERGAGRSGVTLLARNLEITLMVENELRMIEESGKEFDRGKKTEAYLSVAERLKEIEHENMESEATSNAKRPSKPPSDGRVAEIYRAYKGLLDEFVQGDLSDLKTRRREYSTLEKVFDSLKSTIE